MKKLYFFSMTLLLSMSVAAQTVDVPLFDDDVPNLGRKAKPLDHIVVTPSQLPEVSVDINPDKRQVKPILQILEEEKQKKAGVAPKTPATPKAPVMNKPAPVVSGTPAVPSRPIALQKQTGDEKSKEMKDQLKAQMDKYQQEKLRAEQEARAKQLEQERAKADREAQRQRQLAQQTPEETVPDSIKDLFGQSADVYGFNISGIELGMKPDEVAEKAIDAGYHATRVEHGIPLHRTSFYNTTCRGEGLTRLESIQECIVDMAKEDEVYYVSSITFAKDPTAEFIQVLFSSKATDNVSYKIFYENKGDNSLNFTRRNLAKKLRRRDAFIKMLYDTYGAPDNSDELVWGDLDRAYLRAQMQGTGYNAYLIMEDKEIPNDDWADAEEKKEDLHYRHSFTFGENPDDEE